MPNDVRLRLPIVASAVLLLGAGNFAGAPELPLMPPPTAQDRVLVVSPHPDDESLCCAGYLQQARARGAAVAVVWVTAGDSFELDALVVEHALWPTGPSLQRLGLQRLEEARAAAAELGVPSAQQYFLDYPDRGIAALLGPYRDRLYRSRYTGLSAVTYPRAVSPGASYTGTHLLADLGHVLDTFRPTVVLVAAPQDRHPDHAASGEAVRELLSQRGELGKLRYWVVHADRGWPQPRGYHPRAPLLPPRSAQMLPWEMLPLTPEQEARKLAALRQHKSQMRVMSRLMLSFVRADEIFAR